MSHIHSFNVRLNGFSHLLRHNLELQIAEKEKVTKLRTHLLKTIIVIKIMLQANFWKVKTVCYKNYYKYKINKRKWEVYYFFIYWKIILDFCRTIIENPFGFYATLSSVQSSKHNLKIQQNWKLLKENNGKRAQLIKIGGSIV